MGDILKLSRLLIQHRPKITDIRPGNDGSLNRPENGLDPFLIEGWGDLGPSCPMETPAEKGLRQRRERRTAILDSCLVNFIFAVLALSLSWGILLLAAHWDYDVLFIPKAKVVDAPPPTVGGSAKIGNRHALKMHDKMRHADPAGVSGDARRLQPVDSARRLQVHEPTL